MRPLSSKVKWTFFLVSIVFLTAAVLARVSAIKTLSPGVFASSCHAPPIKPLAYRNDLGKYLNELGYTIGVELGVQEGKFSERILEGWEKCQRFYLVDVWKHQSNYEDDANLNDEMQEKNYLKARKNLLKWQDITVFLRNYTSDAVSEISEELDFVYVDARHDYCGVSEDIRNYWPKLRPGGIMAGHDYHTAKEVLHTKQDWAVCSDGSRFPGAVKGAVDEFAEVHGLQVSITYKEDFWYSWILRKPLC